MSSPYEADHQPILDAIAGQGRDPEAVVARLNAFSIELPSWGFADTGTRFAKFHQPAAARTFDEKIDDAAEVHRWTGVCPALAVHALWDFPGGADPATLDHLAKAGVRVGSVNANVFQDQCYKYGSFGNPDATVRKRAVAHCVDCAKLADEVNSGWLTLWFADGTNYPGQDDIRTRKRRFTECLAEVYAAMPAAVTMLIEYKPFEPAFYATDVADWGMSLLLARATGERAKVLVDTGHHYPTQNIEQIVAWLLDEQMLGGFHVNDRRYADDDLTLASIDPYQVLRIFNEIVGEEERTGRSLDISYMVDQSHNIKPKMEAMIQTVTVAHELFAKALLVDRAALRDAQSRQDVVGAEEILRGAYFTDTRPLIGHIRREAGREADALAAYRAGGYERRVAEEREAKHGAPGDASYA